MRRRQPITFAHRNLVFGSGLDDVWAVYRLRMASYSGLPHAAKLEQLAQLAALAYSIGSDFQLLRICRSWSVENYVAAVDAARDGRHGHPRRLSDYLDAQRAELETRATATPEAYLSVRVSDAGPTLGRFVSGWLGDGREEALGAFGRLFGFGDPRGLSRRRLEVLLGEEAKAFRRVSDYVDCERASTRELQWLVKRAFCRALGEPTVDEHFMPQALVVDGGEAREVYRPLEVDLMRLCDEPVNVERRGLRIESERGDSYQALLVVGALPRSTTFPGRQAELLFAPLESVGFAVDAAFCARYIANDQAVALARRRIIDADHVYREESHGDHGPSTNSLERPRAARELEGYLTSSERPPLLRTTISLCVAAASRDELDERVDELRREYGTVLLHRPLGEQLRLFIAHLPGQLAAVQDYDDYLLVEQFGAMVPTATHAVGADSGPYIGHTVSGSAQPVLFDLSEASRSARPPAIVCAGAPGSGKTVAVQLLAYQAFLLGSRVVDVDPKDDHRLAALCGAEHVERTVLTPDERYRGMLDPLRVGSDETRAELAFNFLLEVLPAPVQPAWQTELRVAVDAVAQGGGRTCGEVVALLEAGNLDAQEAARAIRVHADSGLLRLGFASPEREPPRPGGKQVTSITIANLVLPDPRTARADFSTEERTGSALLHLLAAYALGLSGADSSRHKSLVFDEAWMLLGTQPGRALLQRINRLGRSQNATPILATQMLGDVGELEALIGAVFAFGVETDDEAARALRLLRLDADDEPLRRSMLAFRRGRCLLRDYRGRVAPVQIEVTDPAILAALDTTPGRRTGAEREPPAVAAP